MKKEQREDRVKDAVIAVLKVQADQRMARLEEEMAVQRAALEPPTTSAPAPGHYTPRVAYLIARRPCQPW